MVYWDIQGYAGCRVNESVHTGITCIYIHICMHVYTYIHIFLHMCICIYIHIMKSLKFVRRGFGYTNPPRAENQTEHRMGLGHRNRGLWKSDP